MKSYFFTTSTVIHSSLININAPGERDGERMRERKEGGERERSKKGRKICHVIKANGLLTLILFKIPTRI